MPGAAGAGEYQMLESYVLAKNKWRMRRELHRVTDLNGALIYELKKGPKWMDATGMLKAEVRFPGKMFASSTSRFEVLDPSGQLLGKAVPTRERMDRGLIKQLARFNLLDQSEKVMAVAEPKDTERTLPAYAIYSIDGHVLATIHKAASEDYYQVDVLMPDLHPLVLLSYVYFYGDWMSMALI